MIGKQANKQTNSPDRVFTLRVRLLFHVPSCVLSSQGLVRSGESWLLMASLPCLAG